MIHDQAQDIQAQLCGKRMGDWLDMSAVVQTNSTLFPVNDMLSFTSIPTLPIFYHKQPLSTNQISFRITKGGFSPHMIPKAVAQTKNPALSQ